MVLPSLAVAIGLNEAIVLQQIEYWLNRSTNLVDDRLWTYHTIPEWKAQFPFWSEDTVKRTLKSLRDQGLVIARTISDSSWDRTLWYTIDYDKLNEIACISAKSADASGENAQSIGAKSTDRSGQDQPVLLQENTTENTTRDLSPAGARVAVVGSNIPLLETETAITPAAKQVPASRYLPKGLHLTGGHIAPGAGQNAVQVYYERFRPDTDRLTCPQEDDLISGCPDLAKLREVVIAYSQSGYRSCNVKLILDWYRNGIPQHNKPDRPSRRDLQQYNKQTRTTNRPPAPNRGNDNAQTTTPSFDQHDLRPDIAEAIDKLYAGIPTRHDRAAD